MQEALPQLQNDHGCKAQIPLLPKLGEYQPYSCFGIHIHSIEETGMDAKVYWFIQTTKMLAGPNRFLSHVQRGGPDQA